MSQREQRQPDNHNISLPIDWHVSENIQSRYASNVFVQAGEGFALISKSYRSRETEDAIRAYHALVPEQSMEEEEEWNRVVNKPRVRQALRRMAAEARQQYYAGETEEGGFGLE